MLLLGSPPHLHTKKARKNKERGWVWPIVMHALCHLKVIYTVIYQLYFNSWRYFLYFIFSGLEVGFSFLSREACLTVSAIPIIWTWACNIAANHLATSTPHWKTYNKPQESPIFYPKYIYSYQECLSLMLNIRLVKPAHARWMLYEQQTEPAL